MQEPKPPADRTNEIHSTIQPARAVHGAPRGQLRGAQEGGACLKMVATLSLSGYKTGRRSLTGDHRHKQSERPNVNNYPLFLW